MQERYNLSQAENAGSIPVARSLEKSWVAGLGPASELYKRPSVLCLSTACCSAKVLRYQVLRAYFRVPFGPRSWEMTKPRTGTMTDCGSGRWRLQVAADPDLVTGERRRCPATDRRHES